MLLFAETTSYKDYEISIIKNSTEEKIPLWLLMKRGEKAYRIGELGLAARIFREALNRQKVNPDADMQLARIFMQEGEYLLAEKQFLRALENKNQLYVLDDEFIINKELINLYKITDQYGKYEKTLIKVIENNETEKNIIKLQYRMIKMISEQGMDKFFRLYRYSNLKLNDCRTELGEFYYKTGRYTEAEINLVLPVLAIASRGYEFIYNRDIDYSYYSFSNHIENMLNYPELLNFAVNNRFFESVYYLAAAFYANGNEKTTKELWRIIVDYEKADSPWYKKAIRQLDKPFIEPIITHRN